ASAPATIGPSDMMMPGSTGIVLKPSATPAGHHTGHPSGHPSDMNAMTKGCLAGTGVCFISHEGEVFPCGYLPVIAGDLRKQVLRFAQDDKPAVQQSPEPLSADC